MLQNSTQQKIFGLNKNTKRQNQIGVKCHYCGKHRGKGFMNSRNELGQPVHTSKENTFWLINWLKIIQIEVARISIPVIKIFILSYLTASLNNYTPTSLHIFYTTFSTRNITK